jgi:Uma2 family endonuclease
MRHKDTYDAKTDPPPDLGLEVEVSRSALDRMQIFAAMKIPEIWRWDGQTIHVPLFGADGLYHESTHSRAFPFLEVRQLVQFVEARSELGTTALIQDFRKWVREQQAKGWPASEKKSRKTKRK